MAEEGAKNVEVEAAEEGAKNVEVEAADEKTVAPVPEESSADDVAAAAEDAEKPPETGGSHERDTVLRRIATEKRVSLIKAWEESEKAKAENSARGASVAFAISRSGHHASPCGAQGGQEAGEHRRLGEVQGRADGGRAQEDTRAAGDAEGGAGGEAEEQRGGGAQGGRGEAGGGGGAARRGGPQGGGGGRAVPRQGAGADEALRGWVVAAADRLLARRLAVLLPRVCAWHGCCTARGIVLYSCGCARAV